VATDKDSIVMDSFSGSGSTAHAVLKQNARDGGSRKFILIEMKEDVAVEVTAKRVSKVIAGYPYTGTSREELLREKVTFTSLKNAAEILDRVSTIEETENDRFTRIKKEVKDGELVVTGELDVDEELPGLGGGFQFCRLSAEPLFDSDGQIRSDVKFAQLAEFVWFAETGKGFAGTADSPLLGVHEGRAIYLLYNGILKDKSVGGGNVLTGPVFEVLPKFAGPKVIYAAANRMGARAAREGVTFKQTPYALEV
jgi:adenine-specific DNA-methyltransferase